MSSEKRVAVVGGGLVGALNGCFLAQRGFHVDLYEKRPDIRTQAVVRGRSINLALSHRGREALRHVGLEDEVVKNGIPMYGRMIHGLDGKTRPILYGKKDQFIMSVDRRRLNEVLLSGSGNLLETYPLVSVGFWQPVKDKGRSAKIHWKWVHLGPIFQCALHAMAIIGAELKDNVTLHFEHKLLSCNFDTGELVFEKPGGVKSHNKVDLIVGNDGAFSSVRKEMMRQSSRFNYQQEYIPHGYMELCINPTPSDEFAMATNYLHIWPRNEFMMIGLPNQDKTFTTTLFMPFEIFSSINTEVELMDFFKAKFPDSIPLIGEEALKKIYLSSKGLPMVSVKCSPYHYGDKGIIMGDAAHAMVPFYGQGMNAGFEDCLVLDDILDKCHNNFAIALPEYTNYRNIDAQAICDLAMYNYVEMRKSVNSPLFLVRKKLDNLLYRIFPKSWIPLYTMVSFTRTRYHECIAKRKWQDKMLEKMCYGVAVLGVVSTCCAVYTVVNGDDDLTLGEKISNTFQRMSLWTAMKGIKYYLHWTNE